MRSLAVCVSAMLIAAIASVATPSGPTAARSQPVDRALVAEAAPKPKKTPTPIPTRTPATLAPIGALTTDHVGQVFSVQARVVDVTSPTSGVRFVLDDWTGKIELVLSASIYSDVPKRAGLNYGAEIITTAQVVETKGVLSLRPMAGTDITILRPGSSDGIPVRAIDVLGSKTNGVGATVAVEGTVIDLEPSPAGTNMIVADEYGSVRVWIPQRALRTVSGSSRLAVGARVRVVARVNFSESEGIWLVPVLGYDVTIK